MSRKTKKRDCRSGKVRYRDRDEVKVALSLIRNTSTRQKIPYRYYQCPTCRGWHLSSSEEH